MEKTNSLSLRLWYAGSDEFSDAEKDNFPHRIKGELENIRAYLTLVDHITEIAHILAKSVDNNPYPHRIDTALV